MLRALPALALALAALGCGSGSRAPAPEQARLERPAHGERFGREGGRVVVELSDDESSFVEGYSPFVRVRAPDGRLLAAATSSAVRLPRVLLRRTVRPGRVELRAYPRGRGGLLGRVDRPDIPLRWGLEPAAQVCRTTTRLRPGDVLQVSMVVGPGVGCRLDARSPLDAVLGRPVAEAVGMARAAGLEVRELRRDGRYLGQNADFRPARVNVTTRGGRVARVVGVF